MSLENRTVLVTGASRGIGRAIAQEFASADANVAIHYNKEKSEAEKTLLSLPGAGHQIFQANVADPGEVQNLVKSVVESMGGIDILVNNAGIYVEHYLPEVDFDFWQNSWHQTLDVNLLGPANLMYWVSRHMIDEGGGKIVNVSSRGAFRGEPKAPAYGASKAGLNAMSQSLAVALAPYHIFVGVVAPGWVETDMASDSLSGAEGEAIKAQSPLGRVARPDEVAKVVLFLASEGSEFTTGCIVDVNGASYLRT
ncbi:MAG TPA: SDR family oxidoreductase [candidate division Zixibacteria bacterium]|nr:SDR family oxidoreductase [candidate division Zixibacteria bacterium]